MTPIINKFIKEAEDLRLIEGRYPEFIRVSKEEWQTVLTELGAPDNIATVDIEVGGFYSVRVQPK